MSINQRLKFKAKIEALLPQKLNLQVAVAVSGGSDSLALSILLADFMKINGGKLFCITINHSLRAGSENEAIMVGKILNNYGVDHQIIPWVGKKPQGNIQEVARIARYNLLTDYCLSRNINYLATAHQQNDQAENFIIRAEHGSGVYGLSGIPEITEYNGVKIIRPLLDFSKTELQEFLKEQNIEWIEDPSNDNERFARVRARKLLKEHPCWVIKLSNISKNLAKAKECIEYILEKAIAELITYEANKISFNQVSFNLLPQELRFRMLSMLLQEMSKEPKMARGASIEKLISKLEAGKAFSASTLSKCLVARKKDLITITLA